MHPPHSYHNNALQQILLSFQFYGTNSLPGVKSSFSLNIHIYIHIYIILAIGKIPGLKTVNSRLVHRLYTQQKKRCTTLKDTKFNHLCEYENCKSIALFFRDEPKCSLLFLAENNTCEQLGECCASSTGASISVHMGEIWFTAARPAQFVLVCSLSLKSSALPTYSIINLKAIQ